MNIHELAEKGAVFDLCDTPLAPADLPKHISIRANFMPNVYVGAVQGIGAITAGRECTFGRGVYLEDAVLLGNSVYIEDGVSLGSDARIFTGSTIERRTDIRNGVIVGMNVRVPAEAQIGFNEVIPTQKTIVTLGRFGTSQRTVTIHGSDDGPHFSTGCQYSVDWATINHRIRHSIQTTTDSAAHYRLYLDTFNAIGREVQMAYEQEANLVQELRERAEIWQPELTN